MDTHTQCKLELRDQDGARLLVTWLPSKFAKRGMFLNMKHKVTGEWENGWEVLETWATKPSKWILERERDWMKHREATDI